ncbi:FAD-dependent oxidoreductase [Geminocystis sp. GBBB08]|uniref:FAD-dependent oxidoreductase n=1 Tax=Geminocystis sp. GBBB08 TaxID=2604140 RepID=UPI0027E223E1|nr:FAD-dependent oxidoreductase [Geminocystis sp. GBBB08]
MNRRYFLYLTTLVLAATLSSQKSAISNQIKTKKKVIIIGAGIAGLTAARSLQNKGFEVILLEGRNRIGGRLWTSKKWKDAPVDMGASWIHGKEGNPITKLAKSANAKLFPTTYNNAIVYDTNGKVITEVRDNKLDKLQSKLEKIILKIQDNYSQPISLQQALEKELNWQNLSEIDRIDLEYLLNTIIEHEYAADTSKLSAQYFDEGKEFDGNHLLFINGYNVVTDYLAKGLNIKLNHLVQEIRYDSQGVNIKTNQGNFKANAVIVTLPLGVLQKNIVKFSPSLPTNKIKAINSLGMGILNKLYLRFPSRFWTKNYDWIERISPKKGQWSEWVNLESALKIPILLGFNAGKFGNQIEFWKDEKIVEDAMKTLRSIFGNSIPNPQDYQLTRWNSDQFTFGSYSYYAIGSTPQHRRELGKPIGKQVYFAGEATSLDYPATVHGAYLSGLRVAEEL